MGALTTLLDPSTWMNALLPGRSMASRSDPSNRSPSADFWYQSAFGVPGLSGIVGGENAWMFVSTGIAAMRILCGIGSDMPLQRKQSTKRGEKTVTNVMEDDPVNRLLNGKANPRLLSMSFRSQMISWQVGWGTGFAEIERALDGTPLRLWPIHPSRMTPFINDETDELWWMVSNNTAAPTPIPDRNLLRIPYTLMDDDGLCGLGIGEMAARTIGLGQTLEKTEVQASSSTLPRIVVEHEKRMQQPEQDAFRRQWAEWQSGGENTPVLLVDGAKAKPLQWSATDSDHKARREYNRSDICIAMGVPESIINGSEDRMLLFHKTNLAYLSVWEQECDDKLLNESQRMSGQFWQNDYRSLLKTDPVARSQYWTNRFSIGSATPNQVRYEEGENPSTTDGADVEFIQGAMRRLSDPYKDGAENPIGNPKDGKKPPLAPKKPGKAASAVRAARGAIAMMLTETMSRVATREMKRATTDAKNPKTFMPKIEEFYAEHVTHMQSVIEPLCKAAAEVRWVLCPRTVALAWCEASREALLTASECGAGELGQSVELAVSAWNTTRVEAFVEDLKPKNKVAVSC